jgi:hypothetical protein
LIRYAVFVFWTRLSNELRQINEVPFGACERWIASDSSQLSTSAGDRFEITPMPSKGIISVSAPHCVHQARSDFRPRRTRSESVSIVILVRFAIAPALARPENLLPESRVQLAATAGEKSF